MRAVKVLDTAAGAARTVGSTIGDQLAKVNPDVWRELAYVSLSAYSFLLPKRETITDRGTDGHPPVVLVHGLGGNRGAWTPLRLFLRLHGHRRVYAFGYEEGTVAEHARNLKHFIGQVRKATGEPRVDLVAHSLGGLIARYAIQRLGLARRVGTLVTLATPHRGTYAAHYANTALTLPLRPDSTLMRDLNADDLTVYPTRFITISSDRDVYVVPAELMTHPQAENVFVPNISHSQHLVSPRVFRAVIAQLYAGGGQ